ncbi:MAG: CatA-like O-acetyltransferase [Massiliimalia sp.]|jgi:chloramphenicol O-acetyltransferase type A
MFHAIDLETWDRKEIYERFLGYTYTVTAKVNLTHFMNQIKQRQLKFYPSICWCIAKTVNSDCDFRFAVCDGKIGYYDCLNPCYTLKRDHAPHLFTHMVTEYQEDFSQFYSQFLIDQQKAQAKDQLYFYGEPLSACVDISIMPQLAFDSICYVRPAAFADLDSQNTNYAPFITVGKYQTTPDGTFVSIAGNFNHAVNDGYHVQKFFSLFQQVLDEF